MKNIFNKQIFKSENPFLKNIFSKEFEAFFFLHFPKPKNFDGVNSHNLPCFFLNNINQRNIYISNESNSKNFQYEFKLNWTEREEFVKSFNVNIGDERYLFWQSENESWGMISDAKSELAIIGINWDIADQIKLFYKNFLISPNQAIEKLQLKKFSEDFLKNYKPKDVLEYGNKSNPIWVKYIFDCHVENENDKLFYWKQFEPLYFALEKVLKELKGIDMYADQSFWRQYYRSKKWYSTGKNAPVGGWQAFSHKNFHKVSTKFLSDNLHLQLQFNGKQEEADKLIRVSKKGLISFSNFWIYANKEKLSQKGVSSDFYFKILGSGAGKNDKVNQRFEFYFKENLIDTTKVDEFINELMKIGFAKKIYKLRRPNIFAKYTMDEPIEIMSMSNFRLNYKDLELYKQKVE